MNKINRSLTHDRLVDSFDHVMYSYDVERRMTVLIDDFLARIDLKNAGVLDAGCGTGRASKILSERGSNVTSVDLGYNLVKLTKEKADTDTAQVSITELPFSSDSFDIVFCSEVIEHIPDPLQGVNELWRVLKPGGWLSLSTPNYLWQYPVRFASKIGLRPYKGYENFLRPARLRNHILELGGKIIEHRGIHLLPFQFSGLNKLNMYFDQFGDILLPVMINQAIFCRK